MSDPGSRFPGRDSLGRREQPAHEPRIRRATLAEVPLAGQSFLSFFVALLGLLVGMQPGEAGLVTGLSGHWALDDTSGSTAVNAVSGGVNGTIGGGVGNVTIDQPGQVDRAFVFSGGVIATNSNNPRVRLAPDMIPATGQFTLAGWIKAALRTSHNGSIFANRMASTSTFGIDIDGGDNLRLLSGWGNGSHLTSPSAVNTGEWVHVAAYP